MYKSTCISREMVSEGLRVYEDLKESYDGEGLVLEVYKAMRSVDPACNKSYEELKKYAADNNIMYSSIVGWTASRTCGDIIRVNE